MKLSEFLKRLSLLLRVLHLISVSWAEQLASISQNLSLWFIPSGGFCSFDFRQVTSRNE